MPSFTIIKVGRYNYPERSVQPCHVTFLELLVGGFNYLRTTWPGGREVTWQNPGPRFALFAPGCVANFEGNARRDNWGVQLQTHDVRYDTLTHGLQVRDGGEWFACPASVEVPADRLPYWQSQFEKLRQAWTKNTPRDRLWARLTVAEMFRFMIEQQPPLPPPRPVTLLKRLLDEDTNHDRAIDELYRTCGYSPTRLRELFRQTYSLSPRAYRNQRRMERVMDLAVNSSMTIKEISLATGFKHLSHISAAFHRAHGTTLSGVIRKYRKS